MINGGSSFILVFRLLKICDIPYIDLLIFTSSGNEVTVEWRNSNSIDVIIMGFEGEPGSIVEVPYLQPSIPTYSDEVGGDSHTLSLGRETDHTNPINVVVLVCGVLALSLSIEELNLLIGTRGEDLPVVGGEGNCEHLLLMSYESIYALSSLEVP